jgi:VanZ family protein
MNYWQSSTGNTQEPTLAMAWLPVLLGLIVIFFESTKGMSGANTGRWLLHLCHWLWGQVDIRSIETANLILRKLGHFCGYGTLGLLFRRAWLITLRRSWKGQRSRLAFSASVLGVLCTFTVASMDELHQRYLMGRTSSIYDVLHDTLGAILFIRIFTLVLSQRSKKLLQNQTA